MTVTVWRAGALRAVFAVCVGLWLSWAGAALAAQSENVAPDYAAWNVEATAAEAELAEGTLSNQRLDALRAELTTWRESFTAGQKTNAERIATVREQIAALGPVPEGDASEAPEISARRGELDAQLAVLQAPVIAAEEAFSRADGLIREIDTALRAQQTSRLLEQAPSPLNPANWLAGWTALTATAAQLKAELVTGWANPYAKARFFQSLPLLLGLCAVAVATTVFARRWIGMFANWLNRAGKTQARRRVFAVLASFGQVVLPSIGFWALSSALSATGFFGPQSAAILAGLPWLGSGILLALWLGAQIYPRFDDQRMPLVQDARARAEGRWLVWALGVVLAIESLRRLVMDSYQLDPAAVAVLGFPILLGGAAIVWRLAPLVVIDTPDDSPSSRSFIAGVLNLVRKFMRVSAVVSAVLAATGYSTAAAALLYPTMTSFLLVMILMIVQRLLQDLWDAISPGVEAETGSDAGLVPVLFGAALCLAAVPIFALLWGMRPAALAEIWTKFLAGFKVGATTVSPMDFAVFAIIFALGYMGTRLIQGALRSSVLPRTKIDQGGQNAIVSGTGYVGIFLSALIAIRTTGIDLSGLAIVASALSVGIGFGMQNIVQNFVSGIILMIERPVSEGDWVKVGETEGIVKTISVRSTRIQTFDRNVVVVPNADLVSQRVTNWTRFGLAGRLIVPVAVTMEADSRHIETILREIAEAQPMVVLKPPPVVVLQNFAGSVYNFEIRAVLRDANFATSVRSDINHMIAARFRAEGLEMPVSTARLTIDRVVSHAEPDLAAVAPPDA